MAYIICQLWYESVIINVKTYRLTYRRRFITMINLQTDLEGLKEQINGMVQQRLQKQRTIGLLMIGTAVMSMLATIAVSLISRP